MWNLGEKLGILERELQDESTESEITWFWSWFVEKLRSKN